MVGLLIAFYVKKTITIPQFYVPWFTARYFYGLTVFDKQYSCQIIWLIFTRKTRFTLWSWLTTRSLKKKSL
jgi:hypothetical protein